MNLLCKAIICIVWAPLALHVNGVGAEEHNNELVSQLKPCNQCEWSSRGGCRVCLHEGHDSQFLIGLRRSSHGNHTPVSAIQMAKDNHEMFKSGKVSFVMRQEGPFGSLGFDARRHGSNPAHAYRHRHRNSSRGRHRHKHRHALRRDDPNEYIPLSQIKDSLYVGSMYVGTPPQLVHPIFDTGSTNVWVVGSECASESCKHVKRFNSLLSETFRPLSEPKRIHIKFGTGEIEGKPATDVVRIGGMSFEQNLAVVDLEVDHEGDRNVFEKIKFEGIVGLAFSEMSSIPGPSVLDNLTRLNMLKHNEFAFYVAPDTPEALLMFGGANPDFYEGELKMFPVVREHYWEVALDAIYVGDEKICCGEKSYVIFDSGTSLNSVPSSEFAGFVDLVEKRCDSGFEDLTITYVLSGERISLQPAQYIYREDGKCTPAYMQLDVPSDFGHAYVLGSSAFMRFFFTVFRRGDGGRPSMVGVAPAKRGSSVSSRSRELALKNSDF